MDKIEEDIEIIKYNMKIIRNVMNNFEDELCENMQMKTDEVNKAIEHILSEYKRVLKENKELKEKENKIYKEVQESLAFEKLLIVKERKPDLFNQGRFYISQIIYDILNDVQNPTGIHKENKCIQYIDYISVQKIKDKIEELKKKEKEDF